MMKQGITDLLSPQPPLPWQGKPHRLLYRFCAVCLALYMGYALYLGRSMLFVSAADTAAALLCFVAIAIGLMGALVWLSRRPGLSATPQSRARLNPRVFAAGAGLSFAILLIYLLAADPGGVTVDSAVQWTQASTGTFVNWHPVFHTLLLRLCALVKPDYTFAVAVQCAAVSAGIGYLVATLFAWGAGLLPLLFATGLAVASPIVGNTMMYLWKDNAMTLGVVILTAQTVNLCLSRGAWLSKIRNAVAFGLALAFTTLVRHNALLFTLPLLVTAGFTCRAQLRGAFTALAAMLAALALVMGPLYGALGVVYPRNMLEESIGVPMTVICNIRTQNPDALDAETLAFTDAMASKADWAKYIPDQYNSIKFGLTRGVIAHSTLSQVLRMSANAVKADPRSAFLAVNGVTDLVWGLSGDSANVKVRNSGNLPSVPKNGGRFNALGSALKAFVSAPLAFGPVAWYFGNLGVSLLLMLVCALRALRRNGTLALTLCLPTLLYCIGTMCVLCGEDSRFFSFSPLLCTLSLFVLLRDWPPIAQTAREKVA